ncbi:MAG: hypothetical protein R8K50_00270, partial [Mariprofundus sp.]
LSYVPSDGPTRSIVVMLSNALSEYGNQMGSRASVLLKQYSEGTARDKLPLSSYLSDAMTTDFPNLFAWYNGNSKAITGGTLQPSDQMTDRVRVYERLLTDHYWSKINSVYASGAGKVNMAFIRDEVGNWNLKGFDNDPTELLNAYKDLTLAGIKAARKIATHASGPGGIRAAMTMADQLTKPPRPANDGIVSEKIRDYHMKTDTSLKNAKTTYKSAFDLCESDSECKAKENDKLIKRVSLILREHSIKLSTLQDISVARLGE